MGSRHKELSLPDSVQYCLKKKHVHLVLWVVSWTSCFFSPVNLIFTWKNDWQTVVIPTCIFDSHFFFWKVQKWLCRAVLRKKLTLFVVNDKTQAFEQKLDFWKTPVHQWELDSISIHKDLSDEFGRDINKSDF